MISTDMTLSSIPTQPALHELAYDQIEKSILIGRLKPGDIYSEQALAHQLGISKTPVREALINLKLKGFIDIMPQKGFQVKQLSCKEIRDMFGLREALERAVARHAALVVDKARIGTLESILQRGNAAGDRWQFLNTNRQFHRFLAELTDNRQILRSLESVWDRVRWVGHNALGLDALKATSAQEHGQILDALRRHDPAMAETAVGNHLQATLERILIAGRKRTDAAVPDTARRLIPRC